MKEFIVETRDEDQRFSKYLDRLLINAQTGFLYKMLRKKNITLNGKKADGTEKLKAGDVVRLYFSDETYRKLSLPEEEKTYPALDAARIVYEDENILIFDKPAGLLSQRSKGSDLSACEYLIGYLQQQGETMSGFVPSFMNRLDRNTTGLILAAKNLKAARALSGMLRDRTLKKEYLCIVKGRVEKAADETAYLVKNEKTNTVTITRQGSEENRIETAYTPLRFCDKMGGTVLIVDLKTGRPHQIRAHLAACSLPLAGDEKYGDREWNAYLRKERGIRHQLLHSWRVTFPENSGVLAYLSGKSFSSEAWFLRTGCCE